MNSHQTRVLEASQAAGDFSSTLTWGAVATFVGVIVAAVLVIVHRRRDKRAEWLKPGYATASETLVLLDRLALTVAVTNVTADLKPLTDQISKVKQAEQRSPELPFGLIIAELKVYQENLLPEHYAEKLTADSDLRDTYLALALQQGVKLEAARQATTTVQRMIEKQTRM
ncbi:hypothetical protein [Streptomyces lincolnensis]|uniref:hypothetical protein n=1 Tax=Streptomyces lincolnensis TaxID=1915 RepID=UPI0037D6736F